MKGFKVGDVSLVVTTFPELKKPCLALMEGNGIIKLASFNNDETAELWYKTMASMLGFKEEE